MAAALTVAGVMGSLAVPALASDTTQVAFTGQVDSAVSLTGAQFRLQADATADQVDAVAEGAEVPALSLPSGSDTITTAGSTFTVKVDPADIPAEFIGPNGVVSFDLEIFDAKSNKYTWTTQSARLDGGAWKDPLTSAELNNAKARSATTSAPPSVTTHLDAATAAVASSFSPVQTRSEQCITTKGGYHDAMAQIGTGYPAAPGYGTTRGSAWLNHQSGSEITFGAGLSTNGTTWKASGSTSVATSKSVSFDWDPSTFWNQQYKVEVRYVTYTRSCGGILINKQVKATSETGVFKTGQPGTGTPPNWLSTSKCGFNYAAGTWSKTTGKAYSYGTGVDISSVIGIDLSTSRAYTSSSKLNYKMDKAHDSLCGDTDKPGLSGKVQQFYDRIEEEL
ncbi:hypothetical protein [Streptomyces beijiangensis]|uniref:hypothetical protein n=1 Tax=Streptomyces beijiangensis TaxID=163361 RepID=UPI0031DC76AE